MNDYRYILEPYNGPATRYRCPECGKNREFTRYIDRETGNHIADQVGRCNREINCGYHFTPKQYFQDNGMPISNSHPKPMVGPRMVTVHPRITSYIPMEAFKASLKGYGTNHLVNYLVGLFGLEITNQVIALYFVGTSKHWPGSTVFWQIDRLGRVRSGKVMAYDPVTGHRDEDRITWAHKALNLQEFNLDQCLFGEHLLKADRNKPVALVESEKTAIIDSIYFPQFIWLATGGFLNLTVQKCEALRGRHVVLWPDLNCFDKWSKIAKMLNAICMSVKVSDLLERNATPAERGQGLDVADYLVRFDYRDFSAHKPELPNLSIKDIQYEIAETHLPKDYGNCILWTVKMNDGKSNDILFQGNEEIFQPGTNQEILGRIERDFKKNFQIITLDGQDCLVHSFPKKLIYQ